MIEVIVIECTRSGEPERLEKIECDALSRRTARRRSIDAQTARSTREIEKRRGFASMSRVISSAVPTDV